MYGWKMGRLGLTKEPQLDEFLGFVIDDTHGWKWRVWYRRMIGGEWIVRVIGGTNEGKKKLRMNAGLRKFRGWYLGFFDRSNVRSLPSCCISLCLSAKDMVSQELLRRRILLLLTPLLEKSTREEGKESGVAVTVDLQRILVFFFPFFFPNF